MLTKVWCILFNTSKVYSFYLHRWRPTVWRLSDFFFSFSAAESLTDLTELATLILWFRNLKTARKGANKINGWRWSQISFSFVGKRWWLLQKQQQLIIHPESGIFKRKWKKAEKRKRFFWVSQILVKLYCHTAPCHFQISEKIMSKGSIQIISLADSLTKMSFWKCPLWHTAFRMWHLSR